MVISGKEHSLWAKLKGCLEPKPTGSNEKDTVVFPMFLLHVADSSVAHSYVSIHVDIAFTSALIS